MRIAAGAPTQAAIRSLPRPASASSPEPGFIVPMNPVFAKRPALLQSARAAGLADGAHLVVPSDQAIRLFRSPQAKALATSLAKTCLREVARQVSPRFGPPVVDAVFLVVGGIQWVKSTQEPDADPREGLFTVAELGHETASLVNDFAGGTIFHESTLNEVGYFVRFVSNSNRSLAGNFTLPAEIDGDFRDIVDPLFELGSAGLDPRPELRGLTAVPLRPQSK